MESLDYHNARIVFQGTEGAYSQLALREYFGEQTDSYHVETWRDAMEAIKNGEQIMRCFRLRNSSAGIVSENYDLMVEYDNCIVGGADYPDQSCTAWTSGCRTFRYHGCLFPPAGTDAVRQIS